MSAPNDISSDQSALMMTTSLEQKLCALEHQLNKLLHQADGNSDSPNPPTTPAPVDEIIYRLALSHETVFRLSDLLNLLTFKLTGKSD